MFMGEQRAELLKKTEKKMQNKNKQVNKPKPGKIIAAGLVVILFFFGGLGGVAAFLPFSGSVIAPGVVKVSQEKKTVQHLEGGIVDQIFVKEGDKVKQGDVLVQLKSSQVSFSVALLQGRLAAKKIEAARLNAQMELKDDFTPPIDLAPGDLNLEKRIKAEKNLFKKLRTSLKSRINSQATRIRQLEEKIQGTLNELKANQEILVSLKEEIAAKASLMEEHYMDKAQVLTLNRQLSQYKGNKARLEQNIAQAKESMEEIRFSILSQENVYREEAASNLHRIRDEIFQISMQLAPQMDADNRLAITAPVTGVVINLAVHSERGGVIRPGEPVLDIVPDDADLVIESILRQDKITQVYLGQDTKVLLGAFNRVTTPPVQGKVAYISADSVEQRLPTGQVTSAYMIHVAVEPKELKKLGIWLSPGMPATCFVTTEKRTFLQYVLEPILLNLDHSLRETL